MGTTADTTPRQVKIVVTGPFAAGKTTFIHTISEIRVLATERDVSDDSVERKAQTTVAMDFGRVTVDDDLAIHLFGTPGQERFDFMWEILSEGVLGFVLLVDGERLDGLDDAGRILAFFARIADVPLIVVVTKAGGDDDVLRHVRDGLAIPAEVPVVGCDARDREDVKRALVVLLETVLSGIEDRGRLVEGAGR